MLSNPVSAICYSGGGLIFLAFAVICVVYRQRSNSAWLLTAIALFTASRCFLIAIASELYPQFIPYIPIAETLNFGVWLYGIIHILQIETGTTLHWRIKVAIHSVWLSILATNCFYLPSYQDNALLNNQVFIWSGLLLSILGLVALEQLYRNSQGIRQIRFMSTSIAALIFYDLYMYAHGLIFTTIEPDLWDARGVVIGLSGFVLCLCVLTIKRQALYRSGFTLSRPIALYSTSLSIAGVFLGIMAAGAYYLRLYGGNWGTVIQVTLIFVAFCTVALLFASRSLQVQLSVFIDKHFFNHKYDYRNEWLKLINQLAKSTDDIDVQEHGIRTIASIFKSPGGCLWWHDTHTHYTPVKHYNITLPTSPLKESDASLFCALLSNEEWVFSPSAPADDPTSNNNQHLPEWAHAIDDLWIILPLLQDKQLLGFIALVKPPHNHLYLSWEDLDLIKTVGRQIASYLSRHAAAELLAQSRQFDAYNKLTAFVMHDLKNLIAQQALVVKNAAKHKDNPAFIDDMIHTIDNSVTRMNKLLHKLQHKNTALNHSLSSRVNLVDVLTIAVDKCRDQQPLPTLSSTLDTAMIQADRLQLEMVLLHIIKNAQEATDAAGSVDVILQQPQNHNEFTIIVKDTGQGMTPEFIQERLFKPFDTTKSGTGMGIGVYQAREFLLSLGGDIDVESELGAGSTFYIRIPQRQNPQHQSPQDQNS